VFYNRGLSLQKLNRWSESIADLTSVLALEPSNAKARVVRAKALAREDQWAKVVEDCQAALFLNPNDAQAKDLLAFAKQRL
jgi:tetratricopeptide (TPR) repeat protein